MRIDLHTHAVSHRYSYDGTIPGKLSPRDEADVLGLLNIGIQRGLDVIGICDHDLALTGLWATKYISENGLPIRVVPGCECELYYQREWIHVLALNLKYPLAYTAFTPPAELIKQIHDQGAIGVLAHPMNYSMAMYHSLKTILDGMEYRNGAAERRGLQPFTAVLDEDNYVGLRLYNSDYHYADKMYSEQLYAYTEMTEAEFNRWFGD